MAAPEVKPAAAAPPAASAAAVPPPNDPAASFPEQPTEPAAQPAPQIKFGYMEDDFTVVPRYEKVSDLPVCEFEGGPPLSDRLFPNLHQVLCVPADGTQEGRDFCFYEPPAELAAERGSDDHSMRQAANAPNPTDRLFKKYQRWNRNFPMMRPGSHLLAKPEEGELYLCRSDHEEARSYRRFSDGAEVELSGYNVYLAESNKLLDRRLADPTPMFKRVPIDLTDDEMMRVIIAGRLGLQDYRISEEAATGRRLFSITNNVDLLDTVVLPGIRESALLEGAAVPGGFDGVFGGRTRGEQIAAAIEEAVETERAARRAAALMPWMIGPMVPLTAVSVASAYYSHRSLKLQAADAERRRKKEEAEGAERTAKDAREGTVATDITEEMKQQDLVNVLFREKELADMHRRATGRGKHRHILVTGFTDDGADPAHRADSAGSGKTTLIREHQRQLAQGGWGIAEVDLQRLSSEGARYVGMADRAFIEALITPLVDVARQHDGKVSVRFKEAGQAMGMGAASDAPTDLIDRIVQRMDDLMARQHSNLQISFVFDTNKPPDDQAFQRRTLPVRLKPFTIEQAKVMLSNAGVFPKWLEVEPEALDAIVRLSPLFNAGAEPSRSEELASYVAAVEEARVAGENPQAAGPARTALTEARVVQIVAESTAVGLNEGLVHKVLQESRQATTRRQGRGAVADPLADERIANDMQALARRFRATGLLSMFPEAGEANTHPARLSGEGMEDRASSGDATTIRDVEEFLFSLQEEDSRIISQQIEEWWSNAFDEKTRQSRLREAGVVVKFGPNRMDIPLYSFLEGVQQLLKDGSSTQIASIRERVDVDKEKRLKDARRSGIETRFGGGNGTHSNHGPGKVR